MDALALAAVVLCLVALFISLGTAFAVLRFVRRVEANLEPVAGLLTEPRELVAHLKQMEGAYIGDERKKAKAMQAAIVTDLISKAGPMAQLLANLPMVQEQIRRDPASAFYMADALNQLGVLDKLTQTITKPPADPTPPSPPTLKPSTGQEVS